MTKEMETERPSMKRTRVVAAIVERDGCYLCMRRCRSRYAYMSERWEFPGGKVEPGESDIEALEREMLEEMDWHISVGKFLGSVDYDYPDFGLTLVAYLCTAEDYSFKLLEHIDYKWLTRNELSTLNWTAADEQLIKMTF